MLERTIEPERVHRARILYQVLARLGDARTIEELRALLCDRFPFWAPQTLKAGLREALRRRWVLKVEDAYGVYYVANTSDYDDDRQNT